MAEEETEQKEISEPEEEAEVEKGKASVAKVETTPPPKACTPVHTQRNQDVDFGDSLQSTVHTYNGNTGNTLLGAAEIFTIGNPADYTEPTERAKHSFLEKAQA